MVLEERPCSDAGPPRFTSHITNSLDAPLQTTWTATAAQRREILLQRYLMKYLVKAPFPVGEIRPVLALLHPGHEPQDVIRMEDFEG